MALTSVGAFYATVSKLLQRVYIPHGDDSEINQQPIAAGETLLLVPLATYQQGGASAVQTLIGTSTFSGRCAIVDLTNKVINHVTADPVLYSAPNGQVIASDVSMIGDTWNGTNFTRAYLELDHVTGLVVATSTQNILTVAPTVNALNIMVIAAVAPSAIIGSSVPGITAKISAGII